MNGRSNEETTGLFDRVAAYITLDIMLLWPLLVLFGVLSGIVAVMTYVVSEWVATYWGRGSPLLRWVLRAAVIATVFGGIGATTGSLYPDLLRNHAALATSLGAVSLVVYGLLLLRKTARHDA